LAGWDSDCDEPEEARKEKAAAERGVADVVALAVTRKANRENLIGRD
jgi:hypothetical protein